MKEENAERSTSLGKIRQYLEELAMEEVQIPESRKQELSSLSQYIVQKKESGATVALHFICTHNSRRSQLAQVWAAAAAAYFELDNITTFSGGTEITAFNSRAVAALERAGFAIDKPEGENPYYLVYYTDDQEPLSCYSKTFDDPVNPQGDFAAIMTCSDADENCPYIPGVEMRLRLTYDDPKIADDTSQEAALYDERVRQIGRELYYAMRMAKRQLKG